MRDAFYENFKSEIKRCKELSIWDVIKLKFMMIVRRITLYVMGYSMPQETRTNSFHINTNDNGSKTEKQKDFIC